MVDVLIGAQSVTKRFPGVVATNEVSIELKPGRILANWVTSWPVTAPTRWLAPRSR